MRFGAYHLFTVAFDNNPPNDADDARITSKTWYKGTFSVDTDADGSPETVYFVLSDANSNGIYDTMDISSDDDNYGETAGGALDNSRTGSNDDERFDSLPAEGAITEKDITLQSYLFTVAFDSTPPSDADDARITSKTWFYGTFKVDVDADAILEDVYFALTDTDSDGLYDTLDLSSDDATFGEASAGNTLYDGHTGSDDDERLDPSQDGGDSGGTRDVQFGPHYLFIVAFDPNPAHDADDARITSKTWFEGGTFTIDADGDEAADDTVYFALSDTDSNGLYDRINLSIADQDFGDGNPSDLQVLWDPTASTSTDDEHASDGSCVKLGYHKFLVELDPNPPADGEDARITSRWYIGTFEVDIDGDQIDEILDFCLVDPGNSDGIYEKINFDCDDSNSYEADEVFESGDLMALDGLRMQIEFPKNAAYVKLIDGRIIRVCRIARNKWLFIVPAAADPDEIQDTLRIKIAAPDDLKPGFYKVRGYIEPVNR